jgi:hypothetical protein
VITPTPLMMTTSIKREGEEEELLAVMAVLG